MLEDEADEEEDGEGGEEGERVRSIGSPEEFLTFFNDDIALDNRGRANMLSLCGDKYCAESYYETLVQTTSGRWLLVERV